MGLFDYVKVECPIVGIPNASSIQWQTKAFDDPSLHTYRITERGRLFAELFHYEDRSDKTAPAGSLASIIGCMTSVNDGWKDMNFHGDLTFHGFVDDVYRDITARFTDGTLQNFTWLAAREDQ